MSSHSLRIHSFMHSFNHSSIHSFIYAFQCDVDLAAHKTKKIGPKESEWTAQRNLCQLPPPGGNQIWGTRPISRDLDRNWREVASHFPTSRCACPPPFPRRPACREDLPKRGPCLSSQPIPTESLSANTIFSPNVGLMLAQRRRRWPNINLTSIQRIVYIGIPPHLECRIERIEQFTGAPFLSYSVFMLFPRAFSHPLISLVYL